MNEFYEAVANLLEELRCDTMERDNVIAPEDLKKAETELKRMRKKQERYFEKLSDSDKAFWEEYFEVLEHAHFKEEQRSYYAFCAAERTLERLPTDTQRQRRTGLIDHFPFNHDIIMLSYALEHRVG